MSTTAFDKKSLLKTFAIKAVVTFVVWMILYHGVIVPDGRLNRVLTDGVISGTMFGLSTLGYDTGSDGDVILIDREPVVLVADNCNGLELFALYTGFLLCFPGSWKYKVVFIPFGITLIYIVNVSREIVLALNYKFFQATFDFNHKYTYVFVVYFFVFAIWRYWLNNYSILARPTGNY